MPPASTGTEMKSHFIVLANLVRSVSSIFQMVDLFLTALFFFSGLVLIIACVLVSVALTSFSYSLL